MPAVHLFMKLVGAKSAAITGESEITGYESQIQLDDWSWGLAFAGKDGKKELQPSLLSFSKELDRSTTALLTYLRGGSVLDEAEIMLEQVAKRGALELKLVLKDLRVKSYSLEGSVDSTDGRLKEKWTLSYHKISLVYVPADAMRAKGSQNMRMTHIVELTRKPGAGDDAVASDDAKRKVVDAVKGLPDTERNTLYRDVEDELKKLEFDKQNGKKGP